MWQSNSTPRHLSQINEDLHSYQNMEMNVPSNCIHNSSPLEILLSVWIFKHSNPLILWNTTQERVIPTKKKKPMQTSKQTKNHMNLQRTILNLKKANLRRNIYCKIPFIWLLKIELLFLLLETGSCCTAQADLEFLVILLQPPECCNYKRVPPCLSVQHSWNGDLDILKFSGCQGRATERAGEGREVEPGADGNDLFRL